MAVSFSIPTLDARFRENHNLFLSPFQSVDRSLRRKPDKRGGFNRSTQHQIETQAQGFQQPRVVRERRLNGTPSWLGFD
jgi:hypothetical protein